MKRARRYTKDQGGRVEIHQPNAISFYNKTMGRFCVDLAVKNAFQLYRLQPLNQGQKRLDLLGVRRDIVQVYHERFQSEKTLPVIFPKKHPKSQSRHPL